MSELIVRFRTYVKEYFEKVATPVRRFKKWSSEYFAMVLFGSAVTLLGIGWTANDLTLRLRGKMLIDIASYTPYPSLSTAGLWDQEGPSVKAIELARMTPSAGPKVAEALSGSMLSIASKAAIIELVAEYANQQGPCEELADEEKKAYRKIDGMLGGDTYMSDRDAYRTLARKRRACVEKLEILTNDIAAHMHASTTTNQH